MNTVVCTLFEKHHHYGLGALVNSLYRYGFRGSIYAGYRGKLPFWSNSAVPNPSLKWNGGVTFKVAEDLVLHFLPLDTKYHFTNFKPNFMMQVWEGPATDADAIAYFDPDITIKCKWSVFENWMEHGVALVHEIAGSDMPPTHPKRREWEKMIVDCNRTPSRDLHKYINAGFCGVLRSNKEFIKIWLELFDAGIKASKLTAEKGRHVRDPNYAFYAQDQDTLNATAMCSASPISEMGPEAMDFLPGGNIMSHSTGNLKPWTKRFIHLALKGNPPSLADKLYWQNVKEPIQLFSKYYTRKKRLSMNIASFIGRFYRRN